MVTVSFKQNSFIQTCNCNLTVCRLILSSSFKLKSLFLAFLCCYICHIIYCVSSIYIYNSFSNKWNLRRTSWVGLHPVKSANAVGDNDLLCTFCHMWKVIMWNSMFHTLPKLYRQFVDPFQCVFLLIIR